MTAEEILSVALLAAGVQGSAVPRIVELVKENIPADQESLRVIVEKAYKELQLVH